MADRDPGQRPVIRDKRRIDPLTGEVRRPASAPDETDESGLPPYATDSDPTAWVGESGWGEPAAGYEHPGHPGAGRSEAGYSEAGYSEAGYSESGYVDPAYPAGAYPEGPSIAEQAAAAYAQNAGHADPNARWSSDPEPGEAPQTGQPAGVPVEENGSAAELAAAHSELAERTVDLQRLHAEYANYRRRVDRDREAIREQALANVLTNLLPLLDDVLRAREHGDLTGGFKSVGEALEATVEKLGLTRFGEAGEPFNPSVHEALTHSYSSEVTEPVAVAVLQPGYRLSDRVLRPARVAVAEPE